MQPEPFDPDAEPIEVLDGTVSAFDDARGLGEVTSDGGDVLPFHCVSIADGSRTIDVGAAVRYDVLVKLGRREAFRLRPQG
jgi:cold shock CspA family protein